ncbi:MAG: KilA-N domain-containing protein [Flavobacterium sp.]|nr:KilA-N domain-containing protein [Flavobacterium sp.]
MSTQKTDSKVVEFIYQDIEIHNLFSDGKNAMINATEMAKVFGKRIDVFLKADHVKAFIKVLELTPYGGSSEVLKPEEIMLKKNGVGTYFHQVLALKFAAWLDPNFELWVYSKIKEILFGNAEVVGNKISEAEQKKQMIARLIKKVRESGDEVAISLLDNLEDLKTIEREKKKSMALFSSQYKMF